MLTLVLCTLAADPDLSAVSATITERTNAFRNEQNLKPIETNDGDLAEAARKFAEYMAHTGEYGHRADGRTPAERAEAAGYDYCSVRENIAYFEKAGGDTVADVEAETLVEKFFVGWRESPGHRKNMLAEDVTETAVAIARAENGRFYAVQLFGKPASERIAIKVRNESGQPVQYRFGGKEWTLPPRVIRTHEVCQKSELSLPGSDAEALDVTEGGTFVVGEGPSLSRQGKGAGG